MHRLRHKIEGWAGPSWPRPVRIAIVLFLVSIGFVCYYFRLTSAKGFACIGFSIAFALLLIRRAMWKRSLRQ
jgi:hypothetical protein